MLGTDAFTLAALQAIRCLGQDGDVIPLLPLVFIEGSYSQHPYFENIYNLKLFCEITPTEQLERILYRNGKEMLKRFKEEWIPKENAYFKTFQIREQADLLL